MADETNRTRAPTLLAFGSAKEGAPILPLACGHTHDRDGLSRAVEALRRQLADVTTHALAGTDQMGAGRILEARSQIEALVLRMAAWSLSAENDRRAKEGA